MQHESLRNTKNVSRHIEFCILFLLIMIVVFINFMTVYLEINQFEYILRSDIVSKDVSYSNFESRQEVHPTPN